MKIDNCCRKSTLSDYGWAETQVEAATQRTTQWVLGELDAVPTANVRYITRQVTATNWRRIPAAVGRGGAAACDESGLLVYM